MTYSIEKYFIVKNNQGEYFTGNWRSEEQWNANIKYAKEYSSIDELMEEIKNDRKEADDYCGFDFFKEGVYTIETKVRIKDLY